MEISTNAQTHTTNLLNYTVNGNDWYMAVCFPFMTTMQLAIQSVRMLVQCRWMEKRIKCNPIIHRLTSMCSIAMLNRRIKLFGVIFVLCINAWGDKLATSKCCSINDVLSNVKSRTNIRNPFGSSFYGVSQHSNSFAAKCENSTLQCHFTTMHEPEK